MPFRSFHLNQRSFTTGSTRDIGVWAFSLERASPSPPLQRAFSQGFSTRPDEGCRAFRTPSSIVRSSSAPLSEVLLPPLGSPSPRRPSLSEQAHCELSLLFSFSRMGFSLCCVLDSRAFDSSDSSRGAPPNHRILTRLAIYFYDEYPCGRFDEPPFIYLPFFFSGSPFLLVFPL